MKEQKGKGYQVIRRNKTFKTFEYEKTRSDFK